MKREHRRRLDTFRRVRDFGIAQQNDFPANSRAHRLFASLTSVVQDMDSCDSLRSAENSNARQGTIGKDAARTNLLTALEHIFRAARILQQSMPGTLARFAVNRKLSDGELLSRARAIVSLAEPLTEEFVQCELPPDFLTTLRARMTAMENSLAHRDESLSGRMDAVSTIDQLVAQGRKDLAMLEDLVHNKYQDNDDVMRKWKIATRTSRAGRGTSAGAGDTEDETATGNETGAAPKNAGQ
ncbi:MAG: hypothetical protein ACKV2V_21560 [Blastocatellia bacterium]